MCHFITAFLSADADAAAVAQLAEHHKLRWRALTNPSVQRHLRAGETYYVTTRNMCDCGTPLGSARQATAADSMSAIELEKERKKLRKKGWSDSKIDRHFHDQQAARTRQAGAEAARMPTADDPAITRWLTLIRTVHERRLATTIGLLLHMYRGGLETENIPIQNRLVVPPAELTAQLLLEIDEDTLYAFVSR